MYKLNGNSRGWCLILVLLFTVDTAQGQQLMSVLKSKSNISSFVQALEINGLDEKLSGKGPFTVFAPANEFFDKETSGKQLQSDSIYRFLLNHIMTGFATEKNMQYMSKVTTLGGATLTIEKREKKIYINAIELTTTNMKASNGVIHIINGVIK